MTHGWSSSTWTKSVRLRKMRETSVAMGLAARWIGQFHNDAAEERLSGASVRFLNQVQAEYYLGWARRTSLIAGHLRQRLPWLTTLCGRFEEFLTLFCFAPDHYPWRILSVERSLSRRDGLLSGLGIGCGRRW